MRRVRLGGLFLLAAAGAAGYFMVFRTYQQALAGDEELRFSGKAVAVIPPFLLLGLGMILGGEGFYGALVGSDRKLKPFGWVATGVGVGLGLGFFVWFERLLKGMGYTF